MHSETKTSHVCGMGFTLKVEFWNKGVQIQDQGATFSQDIWSTMVESWTFEGHILSSKCRNRETFILLEIYFDKEDDGIGFKNLNFM